MTEDERRAARQRQRDERAETTAVVELMRRAGRRPVLTYRCASTAGGRPGCLLLAVYVLPDGGRAVYRPPLRVSPSHADQRALAPRQPGYADRLDTLTAAAGGLPLSGVTECRHYPASDQLLTAERIVADLHRGGGVVVLDRPGVS